MAGSGIVRSEAIVEQLRADILGGLLTPGQKLPFALLCKQYNASVGVIREALTRLAEQGLVQAEPQLGFRVVSISPSDLEDLTDARIAIESLVLSYAIRTADVEWESRVLAAHHRLTRTPKIGGENKQSLSESWAQAHRDFHSTLLSGCPNRRLESIAQGLRDSAELYRRWSRSIAHDDARDIDGEHAELLSAVLAHDEVRAKACMSEHIAHTTRVVLEIAEPQQDLPKAAS
ncbi:MAG: GntR family transcriptional regulator [Frankiales bacterium]|nr:GntR family transcriptional regulator [Frankiales bacterium]